MRIFLDIEKIKLDEILAIEVLDIIKNFNNVYGMDISKMVAIRLENNAVPPNLGLLTQNLR